jgi:D-glycero-D-manno-heptose 1,7-bisphosphate phosphatase
MTAKRPALFLDRDGTVNADKGYLYRIKDFEFIHGMPDIIKSYNDKDFLVIVLTNQAGIARGYYTENDMHTLHRFINTELRKINAHIDAFYFCPHHPDITGPCHCRKPETGLIEQAVNDFDIDISKSLMVGDKPWDIECGERMHIKSVYSDEFLNEKSINAFITRIV